MNNNELHADLLRLAAENDIKVIQDLDDPTDANADTHTRVIHVGRTVNPLSYFISLHEMAHIIHNDPDWNYSSPHVLHHEINASYWALQHSAVPVTPELERSIFRALSSYVTDGLYFEPQSKCMLETLLNHEDAVTIEQY